MRTLIAGLTLGALTTAGLVAGTASTAAAATKPKPTAFALSAFGIGTAVKGGEIPATSGKTAYRIIGCTNRAPVKRTNHIAEATLPGLGDVSGVKTRVWTTAKNGVVASNSVHALAEVVIGKGSGQGEVAITGIRSQTRAWHDQKGFHSSWDTQIGSIVYTPVEGGPEVLMPPKMGETLEIPGLAKIKLGSHARKQSSTGARAYATTIKIEVIPSNTTARIAHTSAKIGGGVKSALFRGNSNATRVSALDDNLTSGPNPHLPMPCQGTDGKVQTNNLAELNLGGQAVVSGANTQQKSDQTMRKAWGYEKSSIAELNLGAGQLVVQGIVAKANVTRQGKTVKRNIRGTTIGSITANGEPQTFPDTDVLEIPGVARLERNIVDKSKNGISVTSLRITLLDGTGAVINLGQAELKILSSGR